MPVDECRVRADARAAEPTARKSTGAADERRTTIARPVGFLVREVQNLYGQTATVESSSASGAGFVEAGLVHRFVIPLEKNDGIGLQPAIGYGIEGITAPNRTIAHCVDCGGETVGDYHGGQYVRFQLGIYLAAKGPNSTMYGYVGLAPSFQYFVVRTEPGITNALDIALSVGLAR